MKTKALQYLLAGLAVDLGLLLAALSLVVAFGVFTYDGQCGLGIIFGGQRPCGLLDHVFETILLAGLMLLISGWWVSALVLLAAPPLAGLLLGLRRRKARLTL